MHGRTPREILFRIADGDPLELGPRIEEVLDEDCLLLETARVHLRTLAATAYAACVNGPPAELGPWMRDRISESVSCLLAEDREAERAGDPIPTSGEPFLPMTAAFGVEHGLARRASVAFHSLAQDQRRLLCRIVRDGKPLSDVARELGYPLGEAKTELRAAVELLERAIGTRLADRLGGGDRG